MDVHARLLQLIHQMTEELRAREFQNMILSSEKEKLQRRVEKPPTPQTLLRDPVRACTGQKFLDRATYRRDHQFRQSLRRTGGEPTTATTQTTTTTTTNNNKNNNNNNNSVPARSEAPLGPERPVRPVRPRSAASCRQPPAQEPEVQVPWLSADRARRTARQQARISAQSRAPRNRPNSFEDSYGKAVTQAAARTSDTAGHRPHRAVAAHSQAQSPSVLRCRLCGFSEAAMATEEWQPSFEADLARLLGE
ncbi:unnamed protein product, partial [Polarella glacialis]